MSKQKSPLLPDNATAMFLCRLYPCSLLFQWPPFCPLTPSSPSWFIIPGGELNRNHQCTRMGEIIITWRRSCFRTMDSSPWYYPRLSSISLLYWLSLPEKHFLLRATGRRQQLGGQDHLPGLLQLCDPRILWYHVWLLVFLPLSLPPFLSFLFLLFFLIGIFHSF